METWHIRGLTDWRGWRRSRLVNLETWHITENSPTRGEEEGGMLPLDKGADDLVWHGSWKGGEQMCGHSKQAESGIVPNTCH